MDCKRLQVSVTTAHRQERLHRPGQRWQHSWQSAAHCPCRTPGCWHYPVAQQAPLPVQQPAHVPGLTPDFQDILGQLWCPAMSLYYASLLRGSSDKGGLSHTTCSIKQRKRSHVGDRMWGPAEEGLGYVCYT